MRRAVVLVLACGAISITLSLGVRAVLGVFLKPISAELDLGREVFSLAVALATLLTGLGGPIVGALSDRYGVGRVTMLGGALLALGLGLAALAQGAIGLQLTFGLIMGLGMTAASMGVVMGAVARAMPPERRSLGFGIIMAGGSFGQFLMIPFAQWLLSTWDWRVACAALAVIAALIVPLAFGLRESRPAAAGGATDAPVGLRDVLLEAGRHPGFLLLTASFFVCGFHVSFVQTHLPAFLTDRGISPALAANALALIGLFNIFGSFASGWLAGHYRQRYVLVAIYALRALLFLPLILAPMTPGLALGFSALMGLLYLSTVAPTSGIVAQIFGPRHFSMLYGFVFGSHQIGAFFGAYLGGYVFDVTGSYQLMWWIASALGVIAALLAAPIRDQPLRARAAATA